MRTAKTLFDPVTGRGKRNAWFEHLRTSPNAEAARRMLDDVFQDFTDPDGNFLEQFQTTGFDARFFELYLHAYFSRSGYRVDRSHSNPDFIVTRDAVTVAVEATTVNASVSGAVARFGTKIADLTEEERKEYTANELPIRFGSPLLSKLKLRYWQLPQCANLPFVIAIEAFHDEGSLGFSDNSLASYLYGLRHSARWDNTGELVIQAEKILGHHLGDKKIPSGFFHQPETEFVSAILFTNSATSAKFSRMGYQSGYGNDTLDIKRFGRSHNFDPNAMDSTLFSYDLDDAPNVEGWEQGLVVLHNPNAVRPLPDEFFKSDAQWRLEDGVCAPYLTGRFHPYQSETLITHLGNIKRKIPGGLRGLGPQAVGAMSRESFHDLCPNIPSRVIGEEDGWFSDHSDAFLGLVLKEHDKKTWKWLVFARSPYFDFYPIARGSRYRMRLLAVDAVQHEIMKLVLQSQRIFPRKPRRKPATSARTKAKTS
jgi:hypothetical protein